MSCCNSREQQITKSTKSFTKILEEPQDLKTISYRKQYYVQSLCLWYLQYMGISDKVLILGKSVISCWISHCDTVWYGQLFSLCSLTAAGSKTWEIFASHREGGSVLCSSMDINLARFFCLPPPSLVPGGRPEPMWTSWWSCPASSLSLAQRCCCSNWPNRTG